MADKKTILTSEMITMMSKVTKHKLNRSNYYSWRSNVRHFIRGIEMDEHIKEKPLIDPK